MCFIEKLIFCKKMKNKCFYFNNNFIFIKILNEINFYHNLFKFFTTSQRKIHSYIKIIFLLKETKSLIKQFFLLININ